MRTAREHFTSVIGPDGSTDAFPTCFGCAPNRPENDDLALFTGRIPDTDLYGAEWVPRGIGGEKVEPRMVRAAVGPSGAGPFNEWVDYTSGEIQLLGELSVSISELPVAGAVHQVLSSTIERRVQRMIPDVVVVAEGGANIARGRGEPIYTGRCGAGLIVAEGEKWHIVALVRYPSRKQFLDMLNDPEYQAIAPIRAAALADSRLVQTTALT